MSGIGGFRGVSASQDARFVNKQKQMLKTKKFPKELDVIVDYGRVDWTVMREWTAKRLTELLGVEDEVLIQFIHNRLEDLNDLNPKELYLELMPFLEKNTGLFMKELWTLLASAAANELGIPKQILDARSEEIQRTLKEQSIIAESVQQERKKIEEAIVAKKQEDPDSSKAETDKREKGKRWVPTPRMREQIEESRTHFRLKNRRESGFDRSRRRNSRNRSTPHRHQERKRIRSRSKSPRKKPITRMRHPRREFHRSRTPPERSVSWDKDHRSPSPAARRMRPQRPQRNHNRRNRSFVYDKRPRTCSGLRRRGYERKASTPSSMHSFSRSPPQSRHDSLPPPPFNLKLARRRTPHDRKFRSLERGHDDSGSPSTRSPSPRSRNRMSSTPERREGTPSPSTLPSQTEQREMLSTPSPIQKPPTPRTRTPPSRLRHVRDSDERKREGRRGEKGKRQFGGMYAFPDEDTVGTFGRRQNHFRREAPLRRHQRDRDRPIRSPTGDTRERRQRYPSSPPYPSYNEGAFDARNASFGREQRSESPLPRPRYQARNDRRRCRSPILKRRKSREEDGVSDRSFSLRLRPSGNARNKRHNRRSSGGRRGRHSEVSKRDKSSDKDESGFSKSEPATTPAGSPSLSPDQAKTKEKFRKKIDEILEKKNSLRLDSE